MSVHDSEGDKITAALTLKSCFFWGGERSRPVYLSSNNKDVVLILAIADGCNHQLTSHYKRLKRHRTTATPNKRLPPVKLFVIFCYSWRE